MPSLPVKESIASWLACPAFLGLALPAGESEELAGRFSPEANRRRTQRLAESLRERGVDLSDPANGMIYDAGSLLHWNHLRDGQTGGWRERATPRRAVRPGPGGVVLVVDQRL